MCCAAYIGKKQAHYPIVTVYCQQIRETWNQPVNIVTGLLWNPGRHKSQHEERRGRYDCLMWHFWLSKRPHQISGPGCWGRHPGSTPPVNHNLCLGSSPSSDHCCVHWNLSLLSTYTEVRKYVFLYHLSHKGYKSTSRIMQT